MTMMATLSSYAQTNVSQSSMQRRKQMPKFEKVNVMDILDKVCVQIERDINDPLNDLQTLHLMLQHVEI